MHDIRIDRQPVSALEVAVLEVAVLFLRLGLAALARFFFFFFFPGTLVSYLFLEKGVLVQLVISCWSRRVEVWSIRVCCTVRSKE